MRRLRDRTIGILACLVGLTMASAAPRAGAAQQRRHAGDAGRPGIPRSQDRPDLDAAQCRPAERAADAGRPCLRSAGPGGLCPGHRRAAAERRAAGCRADHGRADGADRQYRRCHAAAPCPASAGRSCSTSTTTAPAPSCRCSTAASPTPASWSSRRTCWCRRSVAGLRVGMTDLRPQDRPLRRSRQLRGEVALAASCRAP